jgi:hypothetical protein
MELDGYKGNSSVARLLVGTSTYRHALDLPLPKLNDRALCTKLAQHGLVRSASPLRPEHRDDDLRIVVLGIALAPFAAMKMHQGLPTAGIEIVRMLMP